MSFRIYSLIKTVLTPNVGYCW